MDLKLDPYTIGGVIAISAGGYLIIKAYNNYSAVSVWNTIGMITVGSALAWGGVKIFSAKSTGEKKEQTKKIKADVTKAIAAVGEESAVAAAESYETKGATFSCPKRDCRCRGCYGCMGEDDDPECNSCGYVFEDGPTGMGEHTTYQCSCGVRACAGCIGEDDPTCQSCGIVFEHTMGPFDEKGKYIGNAEFSESQREKLAKKGLALPDGSFPIRNKQDLKNAIKSWGLAKKSNKAPAKKFIKLRAKQLGAMKELPKTW